MSLKTERLLLRQWKESDLEPFAQMNADPRVREFFPGLLSKKESYESVEKYLSKHIEEHRWGLWAVSVPGITDFIGFIGIQHVPFQAHFTPSVEIGWRIAYNYWNCGYATEGANAALRHGFNVLKLNEIVAMTAVNNYRSRNVMEKIGMHRISEDDFDHPHIPESSPIRRQVLYRIQNNTL